MYMYIRMYTLLYTAIEGDSDSTAVQQHGHCGGTAIADGPSGQTPEILILGFC